VPLELQCPHHTPTHISSLRNGKAKADELQDILSAFEDELTCPMYVLLLAIVEEFNYRNVKADAAIFCELLIAP